VRAEDHDEPAAAGLVDPARPEQAIAAAAAACSNWGRWGDGDVHGTLNFLTDAKRVEGAGLVRRGVSFSVAQPFDMNGPQAGWRRRTNPVHTMLDTGLDAARGTQGFPHGFGGADDVVFMPLQCSAQWDGLGHIFDHGRAWNGRDAADVVTSEGDQVTGIETAAGLIAGRAVLLGPAGTAGTATPAAPPRACRSPAPGGCTAPRSPRSPPTRGVSRYRPTSSTTRSSRCTRWSSRTSACTSARCGTPKPWPGTARPTAGMSSGSPPRRSPSPARSVPPSTRSRSSDQLPRSLSCLACVTS
jgi:hypothetical protein